MESNRPAKLGQRGFGLVSVPLFGGKTEGPRRQHSVLLDGRRLSFLLLSADDPQARDENALSWAWSTYVDHAVLVDAKRGDLWLRGWTTRHPTLYTLPTDERAAIEFLKALEGVDPPTSPV